MAGIHNKCAPSWAFAAIGLLLGACHSGADVAVTTAEELPVLQCGGDGFLAAELYGAIETRLDWTRNDLECTGMPRPEGRGVRLRLAGPDSRDGGELVFIVAMPEFLRDSGPAEFDANVTLIEAGKGRFFSTPDTSNCLVDVATVRELDDADDRYSIGGTLYCVAPLPEINGASSVSVPELRFSGLLDWSAS